jgi:hypothetical protein
MLDQFARALELSQLGRAISAQQAIRVRCVPAEE